jgi:predicted dehydrogenase
MKLVLQSVRTGEVRTTEAPAPQVRPGQVLVRTEASLISVGTERMVLEFARKSLLAKARARPDLLRQTLDKAQREGILPTLEAVRSRLDQPLALGYSSAGTILAVGAGATGFAVGDRVACSGGGYAVHAELVAVPTNLVAPIPEPPAAAADATGDGATTRPMRAPVAAEEAAFATLGAVALQGMRLADARLGEVVAVIGLGLVGQLLVQLLRAAGCRVAGLDPQPDRAALARRLGADATATEPAAMRALVARLSGGHGADAVLIAADTPSNEPVALAGELARDRGVVVAIGAVGLQIPRKVYYDKELDFRVSRSYGPGRYDPAYEEQGHDYPVGYVRWTENRNLRAFLELLAARQVDVGALITHRIPIAEAERAYDLIAGKTGEPCLGVVLTYPDEPDSARRVDLAPPPARAAPPAPAPSLRLGLLGAGIFASLTLLPALQKVRGVERVGVCTAGGLSARHVGGRFAFRYCTTDPDEVLHDPAVNTVVVLTRHDLHARQAIAALEAGKDAFVEKPLALSRDQLVAVLRAQQATGRRLTVGFNRRFAPLVQDLRRFLASRQRPLLMTYRVNAGAVPAGHWTRDPAVGGGRIIGEAIHCLDLLQFLAGAPPVEVTAQAPQVADAAEDDCLITVRLADGSLGTVIYAADGDRAFGKERLEVLGAGRVAVLDDFRALELVHGGRRRTRTQRLRPDKGHRGEWQALVAAAASGAPSPITPREIAAAHLAAFAAVDSLRGGAPVVVDTAAFWHEVGARA